MAFELKIRHLISTYFACRYLRTRKPMHGSWCNDAMLQLTTRMWTDCVDESSILVPTTVAIMILVYKSVPQIQPRSHTDARHNIQEFGAHWSKSEPPVSQFHLAGYNPFHHCAHSESDQACLVSRIGIEICTNTDVPRRYSEIHYGAL
jgi:hypothetical protein